MWATITMRAMQAVRVPWRVVSWLALELRNENEVFQRATSCHSSTLGTFDKTACPDWPWYAGSMGPADSLLPIGKLDSNPVPEGRDMTMLVWCVLQHSGRSRHL